MLDQYDSYDDSFPARLKAVTDVDGVFTYDWVEQEYVDGEYVDALPCRAGTADTSPAYEINNLEIDVTGEPVVLMRTLKYYESQEYKFDGGSAYIAGAGDPDAIIVEEVDGSPSYTGITTIRVDSDDGFALTQPGAGIVRIDISAASPTNTGVITTSAQSLLGFKTFQTGVIMDDWSSPGGLTDPIPVRWLADSPSGQGKIDAVAEGSTSVNPWWSVTSYNNGTDFSSQIVFQDDGTLTGFYVCKGFEFNDPSLESFVKLEARAVASGGSRIILDGTNNGASATTGGLTFYGGIYTGGTLTGATLADGDYGDVTASSSGTVITIDNSAVTYAKIQNVAESRLLGRGTGSGAGVVQELLVGGGITLGASGISINASGSLTTSGGPITLDGDEASPGNNEVYATSGAGAKQWRPGAFPDVDNAFSTAQTFLNSSGVKILDTGGDHTLGLIVGTNLSANRTLTITPGDANRTLTLTGDASISGTNTGDQAVASQADMESASSTTAVVTPGRTQYHPGVAKAWVFFDGTAGSISAAASYNVSSLTDNGTGDYTVTFDTDFSSANYAVAGCGNVPNGAGIVCVHNGGKAAGSCRVRSIDSFTDVFTDISDFNVAFYGDQ